ncbi:MAG: hypothetical protein B7Z15_15670 [Rhizobiales bacterium 32-66-8]|nr:MAG: hypothetical protein B7Z15_15670 [Rhizobiales bacterium 32-66-8]
MTIYTLQSPVTVDGKTYKDLSLRRAKAKDLVAGDLVKGETRKGFALFASIAGVPLAVIEEMDLEDLNGFSLAAAPFLGGFGSTKEEAPSP